MTQEQFQQLTGYARRFSFCITCRDRAYHLLETLPQTLKVINHELDEVVIYDDYSATDRLRFKLCQEIPDDLRAGHLKLFSACNEKLYHSAYAKNVAHLLGEGQALVNLDADNVVRLEWYEQLQRAFPDCRKQLAPRVAYNPLSETGGTKGRLVVDASLFLTLGGYDERLTGYGGDDLDLAGRAIAYAKKNSSCLVQLVCSGADCIQHGDDVRAYGQENGESIKASTARNRQLSCEPVDPERPWLANVGKVWGVARLTDAFGNEG